MLLRTAVAFALLICLQHAHADYRANVDLISLHYDHAPDRDDAHATVAGFMVANSIGFQPHVVSGAYGDNNKHRYQPAAEKVMQATWNNNWLNAHSNWNSAVDTTANRWLQTINSGGDIYVAEGGQADFTADVIRNIQKQSSINTVQRINVVQHSGWNEEMASQSDLSFVRNNSNYINIANGNNTNTTADLNNKSSSFVAEARNGQYSVQWDAAFDYLNPNTKLDFSDTVELLHILGIGKDQIATVDDFGDRFFTAVSDQQDNEQYFNSAQPWSDSYSVGGQCYCDTTFDHDLANIFVSTPQGNKTVKQICQAVDNVYGQGSTSNRTYYNTVQCGHDPKNSAADETVCPGIPKGIGDYSGPLCNSTGATWNLNDLYPATKEEPPAEEPPVEEPPVEEPPVEEPPAEEPPAQEPPVQEPPVTTQDSTFPACSATVTDDNNDGYGWENEQTCAFTNTAPADTSTVDIIEFPTCTTTLIDSDGDGYAWENNQTCVINSTSTQVENNSDGFPICSAAIVDIDGDGYAWENFQTCVIETTTQTQQTNTSTQSQSNDTDTNLLFPLCTTAVTDTDADGYGWENYQTCSFSPVLAEQPALTQPAFATCSNAVFDYDADGYGWENNQTCSITTTPTENTTSQGGTHTGQDQPDQNQSTVSLMSFPLCSAAMVDIDSDGYGWENYQTCTFNASLADTNNQALLAEVTFPACSSGVIDHDLDGYGWENNQSCFIAEADVSEQSTLTLVNFPACSADIIDDNGDGYGWENYQTCQITGNAGSDVADNSAQLAVLTFPACSSELTDYEGDGYGWENNQSCVFNQQENTEAQNTISLSGYIYPICLHTTIDDNQDGFAWENNTTCVIASSVPILLELAKFPICSAGVEDENQDGFGWENHGSCRFSN